jgi:hypothetical protein
MAEKNQIRQRLKNGSSRKAKKSVVTGMQNELRTQIVVLLNERIASRPEICKELGASPNRVRHEMKVLLSLDPPLVELVYEQPVRGTVEKFFQATDQARIDKEEWAAVPDVIKGGMRGTLLNLIVEDAVGAVSSDTFDTLDDAHMSWVPMILDDQGWEEAMKVLEEALEDVERIKGDSKERLLASGAKGHSCTISILGYASANEDRTVGPPPETEDDDASGEEGDSGKRPRDLKRQP